MRRIMKLLAKIAQHHVSIPLEFFRKWICVPLAFGMLAHATFLVILKIEVLIPQPLAKPIGIFGAMFLMHIFLVVTHEAGHYAGAKLSGMCVYKATVGPVEFLRDAATWRMRTVWPGGPTKRGVTAMLGGSIHACADPDRDSVRQHLWMLVGGPGSNFLCAAALLLFAQMLSSDDSRQVVQAFAYLNFSAGFVNLVPSAMPYESDGRQIWKWMVGQDQNEPGLVLNNLAGMAMHGIPEPQRLRCEFEKLAGMREPMPLVYLFFEMKALQFKGAWHAVTNLSATLDEQLVKMGPAQARVVAELVAMFRCEIRFSRAVATGSTNTPLDCDIDAETDWTMPCLRPRCLALDAALRGKPEEAERLLDVAHALSMHSLDYSLRASEDFLHRVILEKFIRQAAGTTTPGASGTPD